ncbi:hypothetical protein BV898_16099 [Hypsibius exemplaris]|uniref:C2H2-type domain-containing protein n=1 Tax=Hypsibius exemplaris TaxID=2072580 RepID=A0A9X6NJA4_HYPEX|nr:hypothetical protein BV898_16099 [Hypsibius exemplaris]
MSQDQSTCPWNIMQLAPPSGGHGRGGGRKVSRRSSNMTSDPGRQASTSGQAQQRLNSAGVPSYGTTHPYTVPHPNQQHPQMYGTAMPLPYQQQQQWAHQHQHYQTFQGGVAGSGAGYVQHQQPQGSHPQGSQPQGSQPQGSQHSSAGYYQPTMPGSGHPGPSNVSAMDLPRGYAVPGPPQPANAMPTPTAATDNAPHPQYIERTDCLSCLLEVPLAGEPFLTVSAWITYHCTVQMIECVSTNMGNPNLRGIDKTVTSAVEKGLAKVVLVCSFKGCNKEMPDAVRMQTHWKVNHSHVPGTAVSVPGAAVSVPGTAVSVPGTVVSVPGTVVSVLAQPQPVPMQYPGGAGCFDSRRAMQEQFQQAQRNALRQEQQQLHLQQQRQHEHEQQIRTQQRAGQVSGQVYGQVSGQVSGQVLPFGPGAQQQQDLRHGQIAPPPEYAFTSSSPSVLRRVSADGRIGDANLGRSQPVAAPSASPLLQQYHSETSPNSTSRYSPVSPASVILSSGFSNLTASQMAMGIIEGHGSDVMGHGSDVMGHGSDVMGQGSDVLGQGSDVMGEGSDVMGRGMPLPASSSDAVAETVEEAVFPHVSVNPAVPGIASPTVEAEMVAAPSTSTARSAVEPTMEAAVRQASMVAAEVPGAEKERVDMCKPERMCHVVKQEPVEVVINPDNMAANHNPAYVPAALTAPGKATTPKAESDKKVSTAAVTTKTSSSRTELAEKTGQSTTAVQPAVKKHEKKGKTAPPAAPVVLSDSKRKGASPHRFTGFSASGKKPKRDEKKPLTPKKGTALTMPVTDTRPPFMVSTEQEKCAAPDKHDASGLPRFFICKCGEVFERMKLFNAHWERHKLSKEKVPEVQRRLFCPRKNCGYFAYSDTDYGLHCARHVILQRIYRQKLQQENTMT